jgi:trans-2,3-dihydro-3-hydroxyanthranilate isomerase
VTRRYRVRQVDVFTDRPLAGNPLAVFPDATGLTDDEMQALAREMNLSETSFVLPPTEEGLRQGADYRVRIFTPGTELPFAGHPVIGTCWVLADEGRFPLRAPRTEVRQEVAIGVLRVVVAVESPKRGAARDRGTEGPRPVLGEVTMTQGTPELIHALDEDEMDELCSVLEIGPAVIGWNDRGSSRRHTPAAAAVISTGLPHLIIPFRDRTSLEEVERERVASLAEFASGYGSDSCALIAPGASGAIPDAVASVRLFDAGRMQIAADPATGAAAGPIAVFLGRLARVRSESFRVVLEQGTELGRPSRLVAEADFGGDGHPTEVRVSGMTVPVMEGWITLP